MKAARLAVLGIALAAGLGAAYLMTGMKPPEPARVMAPPPPPPKDAVLVAARDLAPGSIVTVKDVRWQTWPKDQVPVGGFAQSLRPNAITEVTGAKVRANYHSGDMLLSDTLTRGFMAAALASGERAVAIDLVDQGRSSAGGFIQPDDRVDVIRTFHPDDAPSAVASETILTNVRVLAIGPAVQEKAGEHTMFGSTATLELTPEQAEKAVLAQRTGMLTLSLRPMADAAIQNPAAEEPKTMMIIRSGNASQSRVR